MKPKASLKSLNTNFLVIASRPGNSRQSFNSASADLRAWPSSLPIFASLSGNGHLGPGPGWVKAIQAVAGPAEPCTLSDMDWNQTHAPALDDLERLASRAFIDLPDEFRTLAGDVMFMVQ